MEVLLDKNTRKKTRNGLLCGSAGFWIRKSKKCSSNVGKCFITATSLVAGQKALKLISSRLIKIAFLMRKAIRKVVDIEFDSSGENLPEFQRCKKMMTERNPVSDYYNFNTTFLQEIFKTLKGEQFMLNARYQNQIISSAIFLHHGDYLHYHLSANDPAYYSLNANSLILCRVEEWGGWGKAVSSGRSFL